MRVVTILAALMLACTATAKPCPACAPPICPMELIAECKCKAAAAEACFKQCGGPSPTPVTCGAVAARVAEPEAEAVPAPVPAAVPVADPGLFDDIRDKLLAQCQCEPVFCPLEVTLECECRKAAEAKCYQANLKKGRIWCPKPTKRVCPPRPTPIDLPTTEYPPCGTLLGYQCPDPTQQCIDDPRVGGCGMACDAPGICVFPGQVVV